MRNFVCIVVLLVGCGQPTPPAPPPPPELPISKQAIIDAHNVIRAKQGKPPLVADIRLTAAAQNHADYMAKKGVLAHFGIGDGDPWSRIAAAGYDFSSAGENAAWNQRSVADVMSDWMSSPGHRRNVLGSWINIGVGVSNGAKGDPYWCVTFASPVGEGRAAFTVKTTPKERPNQYTAKHGELVPAFP